MADQMNWSADADTFSDLGSDLLNSADFDSGNFGGVEGKFTVFLISWLSVLTLLGKKPIFSSQFVGVVCITF